MRIEFRYADGDFARLPGLAAELVQSKVDVIVTAGPSVTRPVKEATSTIPIVMTNDSDPVGSGFVASLARPGGNITGLSSLAQELSGKRLEILKEIVPNLSRVAIFGTSTIPGNAQATKEAEKAAAKPPAPQPTEENIPSILSNKPVFPAAPTTAPPAAPHKTIVFEEIA